MKPLDIGKLNELYNKGETCDREMFSEMRSNVLLVASKHYSKPQSARLNRYSEQARASESQKIRLVKNHVHRINNLYVNEILRQAPGVRPFPFNENELQDEKAAELANSIWQAAKYKHNLKAKVRQLANHFITLGECCIKIFWDPNRGKLIGYEQETDKAGNPIFLTKEGKPTTQQQVIDPLTMTVIGENEPMPSDRPVYAGEFVFETILPFNLLRAPEAETMEESPHIIVRKMMDVEKAKLLAGGDEEKIKFIHESAKSTFKVFDGTTGRMQDSKDQVMIREFFFRSCPEYPNGYYALATEAGVLAEMELPFGVWPLAWCGFDETPTTPRAASIIRVLRPYQAEVNRASSGIATAQQTLGDDKLIIQAGSKVEKGADLPGIRVLRVSGAPPTVMPGRSGEQYFAYLQGQISEMYQVANVEEFDKDINGQIDPNAILFRSMRQKAKFSIYAEKFEAFLRDMCLIYLKLAQKYLPDDEVIRMVGRREYVNIPEFKQISDLDYAIKLEEVGDDLETKLGKALQIQQILQYIGKDIPKESIGEILTAMPFLNGEKMFRDLTMDSKNVDSDILALDRGQPVPARKGENHEYVIKRLQARMKMRDFDLLSDDTKALYDQKLQQHEMAKAQELQELKDLEASFIPTTGGLAKVDLYTNPDPSNPAKQVRMTFPTASLLWLKDALDKQGASQDSMNLIPQANQADIAREFLAMNQQPPGGQEVPQAQMPMMA